MDRPRPQIITTPGTTSPPSLPAAREQKSIKTQERANKPNQRSKLFQTLLAQKEERARRLMSILNEIGSPEQSSLKQPSLTFEDKPKPKIVKTVTSVTPLPLSLQENHPGVGNQIKTVIANARTAVDKRKSLARSRSSPEVWAAVRILSEFVTNSDTEVRVPDNILTAIILLTEFLDEDTEDELIVKDPVPIIQKLGPAQQKIKAKILADRQIERNRISEILKMKMMKDIMMMDPDEFLSDQEAEGFAFDTLPIV